MIMLRGMQHPMRAVIIHILPGNRVLLEENRLTTCQLPSVALWVIDGWGKAVQRTVVGKVVWKHHKLSISLLHFC